MSRTSYGFIFNTMGNIWTTIMTGGMNKVLSGVAEGINWLSGANKNAKGKTMWNQLGNWLKKNVIGSGNTSSLTDVMDSDGNFSYDDNSTGLTRLWNNITGKTSRDYNTAVTNYTNQYNAPVNQRELYEQAGLNTNLLGNGGVQTLADTSAIGVNGSTFNDGLQNISSLWNMLGKGFDMFNNFRSSNDKHKTSFLTNTRLRLGLNKEEFDSAVYKGLNDSGAVADAVNALVKNYENDYHEQNVRSQVISNDGAEQLVRNDEIILKGMQVALESAKTEADLSDQTYISSITGKPRLTRHYREKRARLTEDGYNSQHADAVVKIAESFKKEVEQQYYEKYKVYPDWNVDLFDAETQKSIYNTIMDSDLADWQKTFLMTIISIGKGLSGSVGIGKTGKLGF